MRNKFQITFFIISLWKKQSQGGVFGGEAVGLKAHNHQPQWSFPLSCNLLVSGGTSSVQGRREDPLQVLFVCQLRGCLEQGPCSSIIQMYLVHVSGGGRGPPAEATKLTPMEASSRHSGAWGPRESRSSMERWEEGSRGRSRAWCPCAGCLQLVGSGRGRRGAASSTAVSRV